MVTSNFRLDFFDPDVFLLLIELLNIYMKVLIGLFGLWISYHFFVISARWVGWESYLKSEEL